MNFRVSGRNNSETKYLGLLLDEYLAFKSLTES